MHHFTLTLRSALYQRGSPHWRHSVVKKRAPIPLPVRRVARALGGFKPLCNSCVPPVLQFHLTKWFGVLRPARLAELLDSRSRWSCSSTLPSCPECSVPCGLGMLDSVRLAPLGVLQFHLTTPSGVLRPRGPVPHPSRRFRAVPFGAVPPYRTFRRARTTCANPFPPPSSRGGMRPSVRYHTRRNARYAKTPQNSHAPQSPTP